MSEPKPKSFEISKWAVWEAYRRVKANKGGAGVDEQSIEDFERDLSGNLFKLWNRLSSGSYFPPPVRAVEIPKKDGGLRMLGVPTVADRIAQVAVRSYLEPVGGASVPPGLVWVSAGSIRPRRARGLPGAVLEKRLGARYGHPEVLRHRSLGPRSEGGRSPRRPGAGSCSMWSGGSKRRCNARTGRLVERDRGTPQGSAISPLLANMFMHYAFDAWMVREFPEVPFERYCDDIIVHARSERQAQHVRATVAARLAECGLQLNEQKTRIVYCQDDDRRVSYEHTSFDVPGLHVPSAAVEEPAREALPELHSGGLERSENARCGARCAAGG